jgi:hypothetical protein
MVGPCTGEASQARSFVSSCSALHARLSSSGCLLAMLRPYRMDGLGQTQVPGVVTSAGLGLMPCMEDRRRVADRPALKTPGSGGKAPSGLDSSAHDLAPCLTRQARAGGASETERPAARAANHQIRLCTSQEAGDECDDDGAGALAAA